MVPSTSNELCSWCPALAMNSAGRRLDEHEEEFHLVLQQQQTIGSARFTRKEFWRMLVELAERGTRASSARSPGCWRWRRQRNRSAPSHGWARCAALVRWGSDWWGWLGTAAPPAWAAWQSVCTQHTQNSLTCWNKPITTQTVSRQANQNMDRRQQVNR